MKIIRSDSQKLVIADFPYIIGGLALFGAVFFVLQLAHVFNQGLHKKDDFVGLGIGLIFLLVGIFLAKRSVFEFDLGLRQLTWNRRGLLSRAGGIIPFGQISKVNLELTTDDHNRLSYRVSLTLPHQVLPLAITYDGNETSHRNVKDAIERVLGLSILPQAERDDADVRALINQGLIIAAIKLVRSRRNCSLAEAREIVETLQRQALD